MITLSKFIERFKRNEDGHFAVWFGVLAVPLMGIVTFAVDHNNTSRVRKDVQSALDIASLAAVTDQTLTESEREDYARKIFFENITNTNGLDFTVEKSNSTKVDLTAYVTVPSILNQAFGYEGQTFDAKSSAVLTQKETICVLVLNPTESGAFQMRDGSKLSTEGCSVQVNSSHESAAIIHFAEVETNSLCAHGGIDWPAYSYNRLSDNNINTQCSVISDPYKTKIIPRSKTCLPTVAYEALLSSWQAESIGIALPPGTYCGGLDLTQKNITLLPGVYVIKDGPLRLTDGSNVSGQDVTIVLEGKEAVIEMDEGSTLDIKAPKSGDFAGIAVFQDTQSVSDVAIPTGTSKIISGSNAKITGTIYLPEQTLQILKGGGYGGHAPATSYIGYNIHFLDGARATIEVDHVKADLPPILPRSDESARIVN